MCVKSLKDKAMCKKTAYNLAVSNLCINTHIYIPFRYITQQEAKALLLVNTSRNSTLRLNAALLLTKY